MRTLLVLLFCLSSAVASATGIWTSRQAPLGQIALGRSLGIENDVVSNPSAMTFSEEKFAVGVNYMNWMPKYGPDNIMGMSLAYNTGRFAVGTNLSYTQMPKFEGEASSSMGANFSASYRLLDYLSMGAKFNWSNMKLSEKKSVNELSAGVYLSFSKDWINASIGVVDLGPKIEGKYSLPSSAYISMGATPIDGIFALNVNAGVSCYFTGAWVASLGTELSYSKMCFVRIGGQYANQNAPTPTYIASGVGATLYGISVDFSYVLASPTIANTVLVGLRYSF